MINPQSDTAVILFGRTAREEVRVKQFAANKAFKDNLAIGKALLNNSKKAVAKSNLPHFFIQSDEQRGADFAEKIFNAFADVFAKGFQKIILVGSDCPNLNSTSILRGAQELNGHSAVLGPDRRGGAYLIGLSKKAFDKIVFNDCRWSEKHLFSDLCGQIILANLSVYALNKADDINDFSDTYRYLIKNLNNWFSQVLIKIFNRIQFVFRDLVLIVKDPDRQTTFLRGPPRLV